MSLYFAMRNNPATYIDPDGRCWQKAEDAAITTFDYNTHTPAYVESGIGNLYGNDIIIYTYVKSFLARKKRCATYYTTFIYEYGVS